MKDELVENRNGVTIIINSSTKSTNKVPFRTLHCAGILECRGWPFVTYAGLDMVSDLYDGR